MSLIQGRPADTSDSYSTDVNNTGYAIPADTSDSYYTDVYRVRNTSRFQACDKDKHPIFPVPVVGINPRLFTISQSLNKLL